MLELAIALVVAAVPRPQLDKADRSSGFERPPEGCLDMDDPRIQDSNDPRRRKYKIEICCLQRDDPRAANPDDPRRKRYRDYGVRVCGPDVRALLIESQRRHALVQEESRLRFETLARDGSKQIFVASLSASSGGARYRLESPSELEGLTLLLGEQERSLLVPGFGAARPLVVGDLKERFADSDLLIADLVRHDPQLFDYYFREVEGEGGVDETYVFSALPREELGPEYPYHGQRLWLRKRDLFVVKMKMFDRSNHPWKELRYEDLVEVRPGVERANRIVVEDGQRRHRTIVTVLERSAQ